MTPQFANEIRESASLIQRWCRMAAYGAAAALLACAGVVAASVGVAASQDVATFAITPRGDAVPLTQVPEERRAAAMARSRL